MRQEVARFNVGDGTEARLWSILCAILELLVIPEILMFSSPSLSLHMLNLKWPSFSLSSHMCISISISNPKSDPFLEELIATSSVIPYPFIQIFLLPSIPIVTYLCDMPQYLARSIQ